MIRNSAVAGMFYYSDSQLLKKQLAMFFKSTRKDSCIAVISPHAGYEYSGLTAAHAIASLANFSKFIILGPNHNLIGYEFAIFDKGIWETPLGNCKIDEVLAAKLLKNNIVKVDINAHMYEHSIEVQLPFLQYRLLDFTFVPISIKNISYDDGFAKKCTALGKSIARIVKTDRDIGVIASSDFSHYLPADVAREKDERAIEKIKRLDVKGFFRVLEEIDASICGYGGIAVVMAMAKELGLKNISIIHSSNSGDTTHDYSSVVSYYAIGFK